jgi:hypothetical protein
MASGRTVLAWVLGAACALLSAHAPAGRLAADEARPAPREAPGAWRTRSHDGANCLYLLLARSGRKVDYADVTAALEARGRSNSLVGLRDAARRLGLDASVYHWGPRQLARAPSTVILYMDSNDAEGGYFALVFETGEGRFSLVNGSTATLEQLGAEDFRHFWSGYVLAPTQPAPSRQPELLSCGIGVLILAGYGWFRVRPALAVHLARARSDARSAKGASFVAPP